MHAQAKKPLLCKSSGRTDGLTHQNLFPRRQVVVVEVGRVLAVLVIVIGAALLVPRPRRAVVTTQLQAPEDASRSSSGTEKLGHTITQQSEWRTQLLGGTRLPSRTWPPCHTYQSPCGPCGSDRLDSNHGCRSLVWFGTSSSTNLMPAKVHGVHICPRGCATACFQTHTIGFQSHICWSTRPCSCEHVRSSDPWCSLRRTARTSLVQLVQQAVEVAHRAERRVDAVEIRRIARDVHVRRLNDRAQQHRVYAQVRQMAELRNDA